LPQHTFIHSFTHALIPYSLGFVHYFYNSLRAFYSSYKVILKRNDQSRNFGYEVSKN